MQILWDSEKNRWLIAERGLSLETFAALILDIEKVKQRSKEEGIPYQTLISSIIHKYITGKLVDEKTVLKSMELLRR